MAATFPTTLLTKITHVLRNANWHTHKHRHGSPAAFFCSALFFLFVKSLGISGMTSLGMLQLSRFINSRLDSGHSGPLGTSFHTCVHCELAGMREEEERGPASTTFWGHAGDEFVNLTKSGGGLDYSCCCGGCSGWLGESQLRFCGCGVGSSICLAGAGLCGCFFVITVVVLIALLHVYHSCFWALVMYLWVFTW